MPSPQSCLALGVAQFRIGGTLPDLNESLTTPYDELIRCDDVWHSYGSTCALRGASISIATGEIVALTGKSGSGKSTLLYALAGVIRPDSGAIRFRDVHLTQVSTEELTAIRRRDFGFVFQFGELVPELSIFENVALPLRLNGVDRDGVRTRVTELLEVLGIGDLAKRRAAEVSGGQAQRAAVARAVVHEPAVVFADEPTGSLDSENSSVVLAELVGLARSRGTAVVIVTHEREVGAVADRALLMVDGVVKRSSPRHE